MSPAPSDNPRVPIPHETREMDDTPSCPFYGHGDPGLGMLIPTDGNQCAVVRIAHSPCWMEMTGLPVEWQSCGFRTGRRPRPAEQSTGCIARCVGCASVFPIDTVTDGPCPTCPHRALCPDCLHRAELLATAAAGQQRLSL